MTWRHDDPHRFMQPTINDHSALPARTLADELRAALQRSDEFESRDQALRTELQTLAAQRDQLAARAADVAGEIEQRRDVQIDAVLDGTTAKKSGLAELQESAQAIAAAQKLVAEKEAAATAEREKLQRLRGYHEKMVLGDIQWRIALARYARVIADLIPLAHELRKLSTAQMRSFVPGMGLVIDPLATDIVGIPLQLALQQAANLGNVDEVQQ